MLDFSQLNSKRLDPYHQLDIRVDKKWFFNQWNLDVYLDIQNVYNFQTTLQPLVDVVKDDAGNPILNPEDPTRYQVYQLENSNGHFVAEYWYYYRIVINNNYRAINNSERNHKSLPPMCGRVFYILLL